MDSDNASKSLLQRLWDRRFFQYLATYAGISWGLIQFFEWGVTRYNFSSGIVDHLAIFLFAILPGVISLIYFHGNPGHDNWNKFEKIFYPINIIVAIVASGFLFDSSAQTKTREVQITTDAGDTIVRVIPKKEYTSRIMFFPFQSDLEDSDSWLELGLPILMDYDLEQDMKWYSIRPTSLVDEYEDIGYQLKDDIPLSSRRQIASDVYCDFFTTGKLEKEGNIFKASIDVYNSSNANKVFSSSFEAENIYGLTDQITDKISSEINNFSIENGEEIIDLPSSDLITNNGEALVLFMTAMEKQSSGINQYNAAIQDLQKAIEIDPNCAECYSFLSLFLNVAGQESSSIITKAAEKGQNLPERQKMRINFYNYLLNQKQSKSIKLLEMWAQLYPQDVFPFEQRISIFKSMYNYSKAEEVVKEGIENGHHGNILYNAIDINMKSGDFVEAEKYIEEYENLYPRKVKKKTLRGDLYEAQGKLEKAKKAFEQHGILNPQSIDNLLRLANLSYKMLEYNVSENYYNEALGIAKTDRDTLKVYSNQMFYYARFGRVEPYEKLWKVHEEVFKRNNPEAAYFQSMLQFGGIYSKINDEDKIEDILNTSLDLMPDYLKPRITKFLNYSRAMWTNDKENYPKYFAEVKEFLVTPGAEVVYLISEGILHYFNEDYEKCLATFSEMEKLSGTSPLDHSEYITTCYIKLDRAKEGLDFLNKALIKDGNHPVGLLSKLRLLVSLEDTVEAKKVIPILEGIFQDAHPDWSEKLELEKIKDNLSL